MFASSLSSTSAGALPVAVNHVALLVPSVKKAAAVLTREGFPVGPAERWEGEGTLEIYVGKREVEKRETGERGTIDRARADGGTSFAEAPSAQSALLLLMEPVAPGAYRRALDKRGPGLHHIAIDVPSAEAFLAGAPGGWLLHPRSLETYRRTKTVYLGRPGMPTLIEVQEREPTGGAPFVERVSLPLAGAGEEIARFESLGLGSFVEAGPAPALRIAGRDFPLAAFLA